MSLEMPIYISRDKYLNSRGNNTFCGKNKMGIEVSRLALLNTSD